MITPELLHYLAASLGIILSALGSGIGIGIASSGVQDAITRQPTGSAAQLRAMFIGLALIESGPILALLFTLITLISGFRQTITWEIALAELGGSLAVGCATAAISVASSFVVHASTLAIARQPFFATKTLTFMLISQSIIEAPAIFAFIIAVVMRKYITPTIDMAESIKLFASGLVIALGCIGPSAGQAFLARSASTAIGTNKNAYNKIFSFSLLNEAIIETPMIFCVLLSFLIMYTPLPAAAPMVAAIKMLLAAITLGVGAFGSSVGIGYVSSRSCNYIALDPEMSGLLSRTTLIAAAFIESIMIYAFVVAIFLLM